MSGPSGAALLSTSKPAAPHLHESVDGRPSSFVAWWRSISPVDLAITLAFAFVLIVQISRHDMWRDEIHSWGLVLASPSLTDLFGNLRYTGHPDSGISCFGPFRRSPAPPTLYRWCTPDCPVAHWSDRPVFPIFAA